MKLTVDDNDVVQLYSACLVPDASPIPVKLTEEALKDEIREKARKAGVHLIQSTLETFTDYDPEAISDRVVVVGYALKPQDTR